MSSNGHTSEKKLNNEQLQSIYFDKSDVVIVAGAGSGKTTVLASRIIRLLIDKQVTIDKILCLTFTKKATAEMYERIYSLLQTCIREKTFNDTPLSEDIIQFLQEQREDFHKAQVSTLDAFSLRIADIGLSRLGVITNLSVEDSLEHYVTTFAETWLLEHPDSHIKDLLHLMRFDELISQVLTPLLCASSCVKNSLEQDHETITELVEKQVHSSFQEIKKTTTNLIHCINEHKQDIKITPSLEKFFNNADNINNILSSSKIFDFLEFEKFSLHISIKLNKELEQQLKNFAHSIHATRNLYNSFVFTYHNKDYYKKYYSSLQDLVDDWMNYQRNTLGVFSHANINEIAQHTLATYPDISYWYGTQYSYIIIDEFQDNNMEQKELLYSIGNKDSHDNHYFFVGDPKQSIYKFRGADIQAFLSLTEHSDNALLHMQNNYRSTTQLIDLFNTWFGSLFNDEKINVSIQYENQITPFQDSSQNTLSNILHSEEITQLPQKHLKNISCLVEMISNLSENGEVVNDKLSLEAYAISKRIITMINNGIPAKDIAILSRTKSIFPHIAQQLRKQNIPYAMEDSVVALRQDLGIDFHAWLSLLVYPEDRSCYATILRSPLLHISDELVIALLSYQALHENQPELQVPFYIPPYTTTTEHPVLINTIHRNAQDLKKIELLKQKYEEMQITLQQDISLLDVFQHFWLECGYRYILLRNKRYQVFLSQYEVIKTLIINHEQDGLVAFIDLLLGVLEGEPLEVNAQNKNEINAVKIMSIHKSKGLEFPYVILANMGSSLSSSGGNRNIKFTKKDHVNYIDIKSQDTPHYLLKNSTNSEEPFENFYHNTIKGANKNTLDELLRVLYVGMTRAEKGLILSGNYDPKKKESINSFFDWFINHNFIHAFLDTASDVQESLFVTHEHAVQILHNRETLDKELTHNVSTQVSSSNDIKKIITQELSYPVLASYNKKVEISPSSHSVQHTKESDAIKLPSLPVDAILNKHNMHTAFGTYCHYLLSFYCKEEQPEEIPVKLESQLLPISKKDAKTFLDSAEKICQNFLKSSTYQDSASQENTHIYTEHPFLLWNETHQVFVRGIIDLLIINDNGIQIFDYKVDKTKYPERYTYQMSAYIHAVAKMLNTQPQKIQCYIYYLRDGSAFLQEHVVAEDDFVSFLLDEKETLEEDNTVLVEDESKNLFV